MEDLPILYEDEAVLALDKPSGMMTHGDGRSEAPSVADVACSMRPDIASVGEPMSVAGKEIARPGIVHRLDKDTSGVILIAKTKGSFESLKRQFQERAVSKTYLAIVHGSVTEDDGVIDRPLGRSTTDFRMFSAHKTARGELREAETRYRTLARFEEDGRKFSLLELTPLTGRTHQIRAHLKFIHHPIVGDALYAGKLGSGLGLSRLALHAASISFRLPGGPATTVTSPLPADLGAVLSRHDIALG